MPREDTVGPARKEIERIRDQLSRAVLGDAWHGPSVAEAVATLDADTAFARLTSDTHSAAEIVLHIAAWFDIVRRRFGGAVAEPTADEDWPTSPEQDADWPACIGRLLAAHAALDEALAAATDDRLAGTVPGQSITMYAMLHGAVQHATYHAGQIMLISRTK